MASIKVIIQVRKQEIVPRSISATMKRKATAAAHADENKRSRVTPETHEAALSDTFPLNDLPHMVLAIVVRLVVSCSDFPSLSPSLIFEGSFLGVRDVFAVRRVNMKLRDLASQYNSGFRFLQELENSCTAEFEQKGAPPLFSFVWIFTRTLVKENLSRVIEFHPYLSEDEESEDEEEEQIPEQEKEGVKEGGQHTSVVGQTGTKGKEKKHSDDMKAVTMPDGVLPLPQITMESPDEDADQALAFAEETLRETLKEKNSPEGVPPLQQKNTECACSPFVSLFPLSHTHHSILAVTTTDYLALDYIINQPDYSRPRPPPPLPVLDIRMQDLQQEALRRLHQQHILQQDYWNSIPPMADENAAFHLAQVSFFLSLLSLPPPPPLSCSHTCVFILYRMWRCWYFHRFESRRSGKEPVCILFQSLFTVNMPLL